MLLRKERTTEEIRRRKGIDAFIKSLGTETIEYGKERLRDYPQEVASGWKNILGITKRVVPESLEGIAPVGESVGGLAVSISKALQQLGRSASKYNKAFRAKHKDIISKDIAGEQDAFSTFRDAGIIPRDVRKIAANIRRSPEEALEPLTEVGYSTKLGSATGQNVRYPGKTSSIELAPSAGAIEWFHELPHLSSYAARGERSLKGYLSGLLETSTKKASDRVAFGKRKGLIKEGRPFYQDQPIERHARLTSRKLKDITGNISQKEYDRIFNIYAKHTLTELRQRAPGLYKETLKDVAKSYKKEAAFKRYVKEGIQKGRPPGTFNEWFEGLLKK